MSKLPKRADANTTPGGKINPLRYCAACTRTVNTTMPPDKVCTPGAWCLRAAAQEPSHATPKGPNV